MSVIAVRMFGADVLKLRKKRGTLAWALALAILPVLILFAVRAAQHSSTPLRHGPAGGTHGFIDALRLLCAFFGPLAAILIGVEAGSGDVSAGVFRDLIVTGRSRLALFSSRIPAALIVCWSVMFVAYGLVLAGTFGFASRLPTPNLTLVLNGLGFTLLTTGVVCAVAVGFASLTSSRVAAIAALIGWQLVASPLIGSARSLGSAREGLLSQALVHFSPVHIGGDHGLRVTMSETTALIVVAAWLVVLLSLGAWRTRRMDA